MTECEFLNSDPKIEAQRQRLSSVVAADLLPSLEGVELGDFGKVNVCLICGTMMTNRNTPTTQINLLHLKVVDCLIFPPQTVSYAQFLYPTNALVRQKSGGAPENCTAQTPQSRFRGNGQRNFTPARLNNTVAQDPCMDPVQADRHNRLCCLTDLRWYYTLCFLCFPGIEEVVEYDPNLLSDPQWPCGRHKRVLIFASYVVRVCSFHSVCLHAVKYPVCSLISPVG